MGELKPKFKVKFEKYVAQFNLGFNFCHDDFGADENGEHWIECYAILHLGKYYLAIGKLF